jgi:predicted nucleotidyltransferase
MARKPARRAEMRNVVYDKRRWVLLEHLRERAAKIMESLEHARLETIIHGSVARGDVSIESDIDVFIPAPVSSFAVETALENMSMSVRRRFVVQATPVYAMKAHMEIDEKTSLSFPLMKLRTIEREFYKFGGEATCKDLRKNLRVPGVDKRLMLIEPTEDGHIESTIVGREEHVAKMLHVSAATVLDRVHALLRRDEVGRTGVFITEELVPDETFEMALERLAKKNPEVRRRLTSLS